MQYASAQKIDLAVALSEVCILFHLNPAQDSEEW